MIDPVRVEVFAGPRTYTVKTRVSPPIVRSGVEREIATVQQLTIAGGRTYVELVARVADPRGRRQYCEDCIHRVVGMLSAMYSPGLFSQEVWSGWLSDEKELFGDMWVKLEAPIAIDRARTEAQLRAFQARITSDADLDRRFTLMCKIFSRAIATPPGEERFLWLWTVLEVFPMKDTTNIRPIGEYLSSILGRSTDEIMSKLAVGRLFGARSDFVHDGYLAYDIAALAEALKKLEAIVLSVLRSVVGLPIVGLLDEYLT